MPRGGYRPNARGPAKGTKYKPTLDKAAAREIQRGYILEHLKPLTDAQIDNAMGIKYLVARNKATGKFERLEAAELAIRGQSEHEVIEVYEKDPSVQAFTDLMNRALDKPAEQEQSISVTIESRAERVKAARERERSG